MSNRFRGRWGFAVCCCAGLGLYLGCSEKAREFEPPAVEDGQGGTAGSKPDDDVSSDLSDGGDSGDGGVAGSVSEGPGDECTADSDCADELACNGDEQCQNGYCVSGQSPCKNPDEEHCAVECTEGPAGPSCAIVAADDDGDGHGDAACELSQVTGDDCDDGDETIFAGAEELCDNKDNDCDDDVDENTPRWYLDCDGDGFASTTQDAVLACDEPPPDSCGGGWTSVRPIDNSNTDCADSAADVYPGNGVDYQEDAIPNTSSFDWNCDGVVSQRRGPNDGTQTKENLGKGAKCSKINHPLYAGKHTCVGNFGWIGAYPACGVTAQWSSCKGHDPISNPNCTGRSEIYQAQTCR